jgi:hypothetical protein
VLKHLSNWLIPKNEAVTEAVTTVDNDDDDDNSSIDDDGPNPADDLPEIPNHATIHTSARPTSARVMSSGSSNTSSTSSTSSSSGRSGSSDDKSGRSKVGTNEWAEEMRALHAETSLMSSQRDLTSQTSTKTADSNASDAELLKLHAKSVAKGRQRQQQERGKRLMLNEQPAAAGGTPAGKKDFLGKGKLVVITGTELNGRTGRIIGYDDNEKTFEVQLLGEVAGKKLVVLSPSNIVLQEDGAQTRCSIGEQNIVSYV